MTRDQLLGWLRQAVPTNDRFMGQLRQALPTIGASLVTLGLATPDEWEAWESGILLAGGVLNVWGALWSWRANGRDAIMQAALKDKPAVVAAVADMPEVKNVVLDRNAPATPAIEAATPDNVRAT